ncbi:MAG: hypothetical protein ACTSUG_17945 [Candidatus Helarchaeota archaeon]
MSAVGVYSFDDITKLMSQFEKYQEVFFPVSFQYNGNTQKISLQYRLRTYINSESEDDYISKFISQFTKNPIHIPSSLYSIQIFSSNSRKNLGEDENYYRKIGDIYILNISNIMELESDFVDIFIDSNFKLPFNQLIFAHISKQPKLIEKRKIMYETISLLKTNQFPDKFQCVDIPIEFKLTLNDFIEYFIPKKILMAYDKWHKLEYKSAGFNRAKKVYADMIYNKFNQTPLQFSNRIDNVLNEIIHYIQENHEDIFDITNIEGILRPIMPKGYHLTEKTSIIELSLRFKTNLDQNNVGTKTIIIFSFEWMKQIFKKFFPKIKNW